MRVLLLSQWFEPEVAYKGLSFAKAVAALGHEVEVLTGSPTTWVAGSMMVTVSGHASGR